MLGKLFLNYLKFEIYRKPIRLKSTTIMASKKDFRSLSVSENHYQEAIETLNTLQSNAALLEKIRKEQDKNRDTNLPNMRLCLDRVGISAEDLNRLRIIHVTGTKGKGSTCAFTESILRAHGYKTGFYSSPHLVEVRERIRINGQPLSKDEFTSNFWNVFNPLKKSEDDCSGMPSYFRFLTIMAFEVFLKEKVDVAVIEVGIGGRFDCTNIISNTDVCGITSLGIDHTSVLGTTIESITWHKAGIIKPGCDVVIAPNQPAECMEIIETEAKDKKCPVYLAAHLPDHSQETSDSSAYPSTCPTLGIGGDVQRVNAALALQLARLWMNRQQRDDLQVPKVIPRQEKCLINKATVLQCPSVLDSKTKQGLADARWHGRCEMIVQDNISYFLDGAHTQESIQICRDWFIKKSGLLDPKSKKVLIFNFTGNRDACALLKPLALDKFDMAIFCPNQIDESNSVADMLKVANSQEQTLSSCYRNKERWQEFCLEKGHPATSIVTTSVSAALRTVVDQSELSSPSQPIVVLITGSLHLIGSVLHVLQPDINNNAKRS